MKPVFLFSGLRKSSLMVLKPDSLCQMFLLSGKDISLGPLTRVQAQANLPEKVFNTRKALEKVRHEFSEDRAQASKHKITVANSSALLLYCRYRLPKAAFNKYFWTRMRSY